MNRTWNWNGARWWKFDLHTHTPKSDDYGAGPDPVALQARNAQEWLLDHMRADIDCVAVTDHNSGEWIDNLKQAEKTLAQANHQEYRKIFIFPGVELSVHGGFHALAILDPSRTAYDIAGLIGACGYRGTPGKSDTVTDKSFSQVVEEVRKLGGIVIPAHVDKNKGLWQLTDHNTRQEALKSVIAWEVMNPAVSKPDVITASKRTFTEVLGSDSHRPAEVGKGFSWIKMTSPTLEGLRLALLDGPLSVLRSDQHPENPNDNFPRLAIESLEVTNAKYIGRLETGVTEPFQVLLNPWLNTIIGGRGTGKSSLLEFLRITMRRDKELEQYETIYQDFKKYITNYTDDEAGLLLNETNLRVIYRKDGVRFRVQWNVDGNSPALEEETGDGAWITAEGEVASRFPVSIYSQKQLYALADNPSALLARIDDTVEVDGRQWKQKWNELITQYHSGCSAIREFQAQLTDEQRVKGTLADVKRQLHLFETENTRTVLQTFQRLGQQRAALDQWQKHLQANHSRIAEFRQEMIIETPDMSVFRATHADEKAVLARVAEINDAWVKVTSALKTAEEEAAKISSEWPKWLAGTAWTKQADEIKRQYDELIERLKQEGMKDPSLYGQKVQERQVLEKRLKEFQGYRDGIKVLEENTTRLLNEIAEHRRTLTKNRRLFLQTVLADNPYVRMEIVPYGDTEAAFMSFKELIERADDRFDKDIYDEDGQSGIFAHLYFTPDKSYVQNWLELEPAHKQQVETEFENRLTDLKKKILSDPKSLNLRGWVETHLSKRSQSPEFSEKLTVWFPEDLIRVSYSSPSFRKFRGLDNASPGQKTAAILAFVLSHGEDPIILDQPEDDLDNHLIYELVVRQIQENKRHRQVIIVTHNANIVVNGDSELVLALTSKDGRTVMEAQGGLQETAVRDKICEIMEGGRDAFERRYSRILGGVEHV